MPGESGGRGASWAGGRTCARRGRSRHGGPRMSRRRRGEGSIVQRPDGRWVARVSLADGTRKALYGRTRQEVADKLTEALGARRKGMLVTSGRRSLADWLEQWLRDYVENYVAQTTFERYRGIFR